MTDSVEGASCATEIPQEAEQIARVLAGEVEVFAGLVRKFEPRLRRQAGRVLAEAADVDDVLQTVRLKALVKLHQFRGDSSFCTWLTSITLNEARMLYRRLAARRFISLDDKTFETARHPFSLNDGRFSNSGALAQLCSAEESASLASAVSALPPKFRCVIEWRFSREASLQETASKLGLSVPAVKSRQLRALRRLRETYCLAEAPW